MLFDDKGQFHVNKKEGSFAVSAIWKKLSDGWKVIYSHESTSH